MSGPLQGIVVLDLTRVLAGPYCTMMLGDLGAEIIKVEKPGSGDDSRSFGPFINGESAYFMSVNRSKKSITLNLKTDEGKEILKGLAAKADILVENFKPGVMEKLGLSYAELSTINPRLIYAASSGFGHSGPYSAMPAYDLIIQGMGGMMSITGADASSPTKVGSSIADIMAGVFTALGVLAALYSRERTGRGQFVDVAMLDSMVAILENAVARYVASGKSPTPIGNRHPSIAPFATFHTADGMINIACGNDELWGRLCDVIGLGNLKDDPRYSTNSDRVNNWESLEQYLSKAMSSRGTDELLKVLSGVKVPCGRINKVEDLFNDPQILARDMLVDLLHPVAGNLKMPGIPCKFSHTVAHVQAPAPLLGEHTNAILEQYLGMNGTQVEKLKKDGVL